MPAGGYMRKINSFQDTATTGRVVLGLGDGTTLDTFRLGNHVDARAHGVTTTATDNTSALQAALNAATGRTLFIPPGTYKITGELTIPTGVTIEAAGATIDATGIPAATALAQQHAFRSTGTLGADLTVGTAITKWSRTVAGISSTTGLAAGDLVLITNDERPVPGMTRTDRDKGELNIIRSVDSSTQITLTAGALFDYGTTGLIVRKVTPVKDVTIRGLTINMGGAGSGHNGVAVRYGQGVHIDNLTINGAEDTAVNLRTVWDGQVRNCTIRDSTSSATLGNTGYGVSVAEASRHCLVADNDLRNCRHFIAGGGEWPAAFVNIEGNHGTRSSAAGYDCHESTFHWTFTRNTATGVQSGFIIRGQHITVDRNEVVESTAEPLKVATWDGVTEQRGIRVTGNVFRKCGGSLFVEGRSSGGEPACLKIDLTVTGNEVHDVTGIGIFVGNFSNAEVSRNTVRSATGEGIRCDGISGTPSAGLMLGENRVISAGSHGIRVQWVDNVEIVGGQVTSSGTHGIDLNTVTRSNITGMTIRTPATNGVSVAGGSNHMFNGCHVSGGTNTGYDAYRVSGSNTVSINGGYIQSARRAIYSTTTDNVIVTGVNAKDTTSADKINVDATNKVVANNLV